MGLTAADAVAFLKTNKAIAKINFSLLRYKVWPGGYQQHVADAIASPDENRNIHIKASSTLISLGARASYYAEWDAMAVFPSFNILDPNDQTYFVHECTHALIDIQSLGVVDYHENEAVAFVAEALFSFAAGYTPVGSDPIRLASQAIAKPLLAGSYWVPAADATSLVSTIRSSPHYKGRTPITSNAFTRSTMNNFLRF